MSYTLSNKKQVLIKPCRVVGYPEEARREIDIRYHFTFVDNSVDIAGKVIAVRTKPSGGERRHGIKNLPLLDPRLQLKFR